MSPFAWTFYFSICLLLAGLPCFKSAPDGKEYDFEEVTPEQEVTPSMDIEYQVEETRNTDTSSWECGRSPSFLGIRTSGLPLNDKQRSKQKTTRKKTLSTISHNQFAPDQFIINGTEVLRGQIPWMVAITKYQFNRNPRWKVICGGALLNDRLVLTASHCLVGRYKDTLEVVFNVDDSSLISNDVKVVRRKIKRYTMHPDYNSVTIDNDIALIEIDKPLEITDIPENVWPVCLPAKDQDYSHNLGTVSGWGYTKWLEGKGVQGNSSTYLRKAYVPILTHEECLQTSLASKNDITENMICAGFSQEGGTDSCLNDSGGPLTIEEDGRTQVVGIVSWGIGCGLKGHPGVYTKISNYLEWIEEYMKSTHYTSTILLA